MSMPSGAIRSARSVSSVMWALASYPNGKGTSVRLAVTEKATLGQEGFAFDVCMKTGTANGRQARSRAQHLACNRELRHQPAEQHTR